MTLSIELTTGGWFEGLPRAQAQTLSNLLDSGSSEDEVGESWLTKAGSSTTAGFGVGGPLQSFHSNVKAEFVAFICGDPKYENERQQAVQIWNNQGKVGLVSMVAAVVASTVGLAAAAIVPVVALLFSLASKIGLNAFCGACNATPPATAGQSPVV